MRAGTVTVTEWEALALHAKERAKRPLIGGLPADIVHEYERACAAPNMGGQPLTPSPRGRKAAVITFAARTPLTVHRCTVCGSVTSRRAKYCAPCRGKHDKDRNVHRLETLRERNRTAVAKHRQEKMARGECLECGCRRRVAVGHSRCEVHMAERRVGRPRRGEVAAVRLCVRCGTQPRASRHSSARYCTACKREAYLEVERRYERNLTARKRARRQGAA